MLLEAHMSLNIANLKNIINEELDRATKDVNYTGDIDAVQECITEIQNFLAESSDLYINSSLELKKNILLDLLSLLQLVENYSNKWSDM